MRYSQELREIVLRRVLPQKSESISLVAKEEGISVQTILNWRNKALGEGFAPKTEEQVGIRAINFMMFLKQLAWQRQNSINIHVKKFFY